MSGISMGTSSEELWKYYKFETYQEFTGIIWEFMRINWKCIKLYHILYKHKYKEFV